THPQRNCVKQSTSRGYGCRGTGVAIPCAVTRNRPRGESIGRLGMDVRLWVGLGLLGIATMMTACASATSESKRRTSGALRLTDVPDDKNVDDHRLPPEPDVAGVGKPPVAPVDTTPRAIPDRDVERTNADSSAPTDANPSPAQAERSHDAGG